MKHKISIIVALSIGLIVLLGPWDWEQKQIGLSATVGSWIAITAYGAYAIRLNWFLQSINRTHSRSIALTFDDGPDPKITPMILSILKEKEVPATFFLIGEKAEKYPHLVKQILEEGHEIGNHTWSHAYRIGFFSKKRLAMDIEKCNLAITSITGKSIRLFRPPFGVTTPRYAHVLERLGMVSVGWSLRSYDTMGKDEEKLLARLQRKLMPGQIVLLHDTMPVTALVLPKLIAYCRDRQMDFVKIKAE